MRARIIVEIRRDSLYIKSGLPGKPVIRLTVNEKEVFLIPVDEDVAGSLQRQLEHEKWTLVTTVSKKVMEFRKLV